LRLDRRELRRPAPGEAVVQVHRAAICGTDLHHLECGRCDQCLRGRGHTCLALRTFGKMDQGAFAEYAVIPVALLRRTPAGIPHRHACLREPLGIAVRAVRESGVGQGSLLVMGCGPIGLLTVAAARALGVARVAAVEPSVPRRAIASDLGAVAVDGGGFDAAIDASGHPAAIADAMERVRPGGTVVVTGMPEAPMPIDVGRHIVLREVTLRGIYGRMLRQTWEETDALLATLAPALDRIVTHEFTLDQFDRAFEVALSGTAGKVEFVMPGARS
jgi:threonine 3-dehydrogenase